MKGDLTYFYSIDLVLKAWISCVQIAVPDVVETASDADILLFVIPHQFINGTCSPLKGKLKAGAKGVSLIKVRRGRGGCPSSG